MAITISMRDKPAPKALRAPSKKAQAESLSFVGQCAIKEGDAGGDSVKAVVLALRNCDSEARRKDVRLTYIAGIMASAFPSNLPDNERIALYVSVQAYRGATGTGKLKPGEKRRTKEQETAYATGRQSWGRILSRAGIKPLDNRGASGKGKSKGKGKVKAGQGKPTETVKTVTVPAVMAARYMPPKEVSKESAIAYFIQQGATMLAYTESTNQKLMKSKGETIPVQLSTIVADFKANMEKAVKDLQAKGIIKASE